MGLNEAHGRAGRASLTGGPFRYMWLVASLLSNVDAINCDDFQHTS